MKFSSKEDVEAPIEHVFDMLADFDSHQRQAFRRGIQVQRTDTRAEPGVGCSWHAVFDLRGKTRDIDVVVAAFDRPESIHFASDSQGLIGEMTMELKERSPTRTRMAISVELKPKTLSARLLVQSMKLGKKTLNKRFKLRVAEYAKTLEERHQAKTA
ncbi:SRPBCC family protein [Marinibacterium profundimaris]|uniref:DNA polymerase III subunit gamma/tau n=1 Tax=Marinibacterium profundimaris TaxID=1679460 RepID=A0A225NI32_9RHOB|nr:SRPBCC family protein [Marinibacterium profundimaris]OWU73485.1 DNA polymerase III subunit gamma/tau [Marinibacterium profundimaris]